MTQENEISANSYREQRIANLKALAEKGIRPKQGGFRRSGSIAVVRAQFEEGKAVTLAGRMMTIRGMGKSIFGDIQDGTARIQLYCQKQALSDVAFEGFKLLDLGDWVGISGTYFTTRTGELTIKVESWELLSKALLPMPEKWHGLQDVEARYRQRYLDLTSNDGVRELFNKRIAAVREIRRYLEDRGYQEVETPMMQPAAGGAAAKPFETHYSALDTRMYLRIAPELYLKRLLVGGFDKIFELNRSFRNEGLDRTHNPEFTMMEIYEAYTDLRGMKALIEGLVTHVATSVFGSLKAGTAAQPINMELPWRDVSYAEIIKERMGADWYTIPKSEKAGRLAKLGVSSDPTWDDQALTHEAYEKVVERTLINPTFVTRLPSSLVPLASPCTDDPSCADVFELVMGGQEIAPAYTEMHDALLQRERFMEQAGGDTAQLDEDFLTALEHGMPPAGGMGVGIDRLVVILSGAESIRDVILFPQLRPKS
jgi:lysyl-tRNA synthetase class 2